MPAPGFDIIPDGKPPETPEASAAELDENIPAPFGQFASEQALGMVKSILNVGEQGIYEGSGVVAQALRGGLMSAPEGVAGLDFGGVPEPGSVPSPMLSPEDYNSRFAPPGNDGKPVSLGSEPMPEGVAKLIGEAKREEIERENVTARFESAHSWPVNFAAQMIGFMLDPLRAATVFIPGVGEEAIAARLGGGLLANIAGRVAAGAITGAAAQAPVAALQYGLGTQEASDYGLRDALQDVFYGAAGNAIFHTGVSTGAELLRGHPLFRGTALVPGIAPEAARIDEADAATKHAAMSSAVGEMVEGKPTEVTPMFQLRTPAVFGEGFESDEGPPGPGENLSFLPPTSRPMRASDMGPPVPDDLAAQQRELYDGGFAPGVAGEDLRATTREVYGPPEPSPGEAMNTFRTTVNIGGREITVEGPTAAGRRGVASPTEPAPDEAFATAGPARGGTPPVPTQEPHAAGATIRVHRVVSGAGGEAERPNGLYVSIVDEPDTFVSPHIEPGETIRGQSGYLSARTPLVVSGDEQVEHQRFREFKRGSASAGVAALKRLVAPDEFDELMRMSKAEVIARIKEEFPSLDISRRAESRGYDAYDMLEVLAAQKARAAGYDAIIARSTSDPDLSEAVALEPGIVRFGNATTENIGKFAEPAVAGAEVPREAPITLARPREPQRLIGYLRSQGGVRDEGGDVRQNIGGAIGRPGLVNNATGLPLDEAALRAWQAGFIPGEARPNTNALLDAIDEDHKGVPHYSQQDEQAVGDYREALARNNEIDRLSNETGIEWRGKTRSQFWGEVSDHLSQEDAARTVREMTEAHEASYAEFEARAKTWMEEHGKEWNPEDLYARGEPRTLADADREWREAEAAAAMGERERGAERPGFAGGREGAGEAGQGPGGGGAGPGGRAVTEMTEQGEQRVMPGMERSAVQAAAAREAAGGGRLRPGVEQQAPGGLFADPEVAAAQLDFDRLSATLDPEDRVELDQARAAVEAADAQTAPEVLAEAVACLKEAGA